MSNQFKVLIIEDELLARQRFKKLLLPYSDEIEIIGEATNGEEGLNLIESLNPEFIFLDIQMPVMNGFEMILKLSKQPYIIFTTAYDEYAIKAFEENSIDYLLKPIRPERLAITIEKMRNVMKTNREAFLNQNDVKTLLSQIAPVKEMTSITVHSGDRIIIVNLNEIVFFSSEDKLTVIYTTAGKKHIITQSLTQLEKKIPDYFMKISRSNLINRDMITEIRKGFNGKLVFYMDDSNKTKLTTGSTYTASIKEKLKF